MSEMRGVVAKIVFTIKYPDGSTKESVVEPNTRINAVLFERSFMDDSMADLFEVSKDDWKKNPAMIIVDGDELIPNCDYPQCQNA